MHYSIDRLLNQTEYLIKRGYYRKACFKFEDIGRAFYSRDPRYVRETDEDENASLYERYSELLDLYEAERLAAHVR